MDKEYFQVSDASLEEFRKNGVICLRNVLTQDWLERLSIGIQNIINNPEGSCAICNIPSETGKFFNGFFSSLTETSIAEFIQYSPIKDYVRHFNQSARVRFFYDQLLAKAPSTFQRTPWHSDRDYFPFQGNQILSVWIPLDPVSPETGTMSFIPGSHLKPIDYFVQKCPNKESVDQNKGMYVLPDFEQFPDLFEIVTWTLAPGDLLIFHIDTLHCAGGNSSPNQWRRALSTRWLGDDVTVCEQKRHILEKPEIKEFLIKMGKPWKRCLDDSLFPLV